MTTQIGNVLCKRSAEASLFALNFLQPGYRREAPEAIALWRPRHAPALFDSLAPVTAWLAKFFARRHYIVFNLVSNPLIDLGILFELLLCYFFFYTPLAKIYFFAPVPWHTFTCSPATAR